MQSYSYSKTPDGKFQILDERGRAVDWPLIDTEDEARVEVREFNREILQLRSDEASEAFGLMCMGAA